MTFRRTTLAAALTASLSLTLVAGCSGQGSDSSSTAKNKSSKSAASNGAGASTGDSSTSGSSTSRTEADPGLPTDAELAQAKKDVSKLSTRALAGQLIVGYFVGNDAQAATKALEKDGLGGVIIMGDNVPADVTTGMPAMAKSLNDAMKKSGRDWPATMGVDQEGGPVQRLTSPVMQLPGGMAFGAANNASVSTDATKALGQELRALGFTMVMAPDADVTIGRADTTIGVRSPGSDPQRVSEAVKAQVKGFQQAGVVPVIKHFPGHGSVTTDTHVDLAHQNHDVSWLMKRDWVPFQQAIKAGVPAVMTAHIVVDKVDPNVPGTLSPKVLTDTVRKKMGFKGLIVTDALNMGAIQKNYDRGGAAAVSAIKAGADVLLMPHSATESVDAIVQAVDAGELTRERLIESAARNVATLRHQQTQQPAASIIGTHKAQADALAAASITQLGGKCQDAAIAKHISLKGGTAAERAALTKALAREGVTVDGTGKTVSLISGGTYNAGKASAAGGSEATSAGGRGASATQAQVQIALDVPYALANRPSSALAFATYGNTQATFDVLAKVLAGKVRASGTLPVAVGNDKVGAGACSAK